MCSKELLGLNFTRKYVDLPMLYTYNVYIHLECTLLWRLNKQDNKIGKRTQNRYKVGMLCMDVLCICGSALRTRVKETNLI